jgi:hypothetical protein
MQLYSIIYLLQRLSEAEAYNRLINELHEAESFLRNWQFLI